jgi:hypothetical protein
LPSLFNKIVIDTIDLYCICTCQHRQEHQKRIIRIVSS